MGFTIRRPRAAIRKFDPTPDYWYDTKLVTTDRGGAEIITYWRNPEIAGIWELHYRVLPKCFRELLRQELIEQDGSKDSNLYTLSAKGRERLGKA